jgi:putative pyruvate formate lyase activating enzyme
MMIMTTGSYVHLLANGTLAKRVEQLNAMLECCVLCPHQCEVNRLKGERGYCQTLAKAVVSGVSPHFGEEPELVGRTGSGTIFFSHCNLSCVFCQNYEISYCGEGEEVDGETLAGFMLHLQKQKCHNINLVSPGHIIPQIVEAIYLAASRGLTIPIVYNTNGYDLTDSLHRLDGIVDIYMPDLKFADDELAQKYLGVKQYATIAKAALKEMYRQVGDLKVDEDGIAECGLLIRHLVMPENLAGTEEIMQFITAEISPETYINLMDQYYPAHQADQYKELSRRITEQEFRRAVEVGNQAGLTQMRC